MSAQRPVVTDSHTLTALAHPVRLDLLNQLMADGPATASVCAKAVGDTASNCSYHLRVLARYGLVEATDSTDGRERPWRATITGFTTGDPEPGSPGAARAAGVAAAALQLEQRQTRDYLAARDDVPAPWREADTFNTYGLRLTAEELTDLTGRLDELIRPFLAPTRSDPPPTAGTVHLSVQAFLAPRQR